MIPSRFHGQVVIVTGAAHGIGRGIANRFADEGAHIALLDIDDSTLATTSAEMQAKGARVLPIKVDVSNPNDVAKAVAAVRAELGIPDVLVNNAGVYTSSPLLEVTADDWKRTIDVNLTGVFYCSQAVAPYLIERQYGRIVNISSTGAKIGWPRNHAYCASKAGVVGLTRVLALDLAPYHVTVNSICPGNTDTDMMRAVDENITRTEGLPTGTFLREQITRIPLGRLAEPADIAALVCFLASPEASHITGQAINVDGGTVMY